ncbi:hypothetical protein Hdeb2414_s0003g00085121 [Helianthus debilis subsp. tardiflorus]
MYAPDLSSLVLPKVWRAKTRAINEHYKRVHIGCYTYYNLSMSETTAHHTYNAPLSGTYSDPHQQLGYGPPESSKEKELTQSQVSS